MPCPEEHSSSLIFLKLLNVLQVSTCWWVLAELKRDTRKRQETRCKEYAAKFAEVVASLAFEQQSEPVYELGLRQEGLESEFGVLSPSQGRLSAPQRPLLAWLQDCETKQVVLQVLWKAYLRPLRQTAVSSSVEYRKQEAYRKVEKGDQTTAFD